MCFLTQAMWLIASMVTEYELGTPNTQCTYVFSKTDITWYLSFEKRV